MWPQVGRRLIAPDCSLAVDHKGWLLRGVVGLGLGRRQAATPKGGTVGSYGHWGPRMGDFPGKAPALILVYMPLTDLHAISNTMVDSVLMFTCEVF